MGVNAQKKDRKKDKKKKSSGQATNFMITLITLTIVFVFFGYLIGTYAVGALQEQHQTSTQPVRQDAIVSAPVVARQTTPTPPPTVQEVSPPAPDTSQSETLYRVQVGVFSERGNADRMLAMLKEEGYEGIILSGPPYRVQTGAFSSQQNAAKLVEELVQKGFEAIIVR